MGLLKSFSFYMFCFADSSRQEQHINQKADAIQTSSEQFQKRVEGYQEMFISLNRWPIQYILFIKQRANNYIRLSSRHTLF